jgi:hypothetical protein
MTNDDDVVTQALPGMHTRVQSKQHAQAGYGRAEKSMQL